MITPLPLVLPVVAAVVVATVVVAAAVIALRFPTGLAMASGQSAAK